MYISTKTTTIRKATTASSMAIAAYTASKEDITFRLGELDGTRGWMDVVFGGL
jgi:hypothetical protein